MIKLLFWILAALFFLLGLVGLVIPIVPQVPFFALAFFFASTACPAIRKKLTKSRLFKKHLKPYLKENGRIWKFLYGE